MMDHRFNPEEIGKQLGTESVDTAVGKVEAYCAYERQRIELTNEPAILALQTEAGLLIDEKRGLEDRLRHAPPAADFRTRKRKTAYYWTVAVLLTATGFVSTVLALDPFQLGWRGYLYCLGITVVSPFVIETMLCTWNVEKFLKYLATLASIAALASLMCLAVVRGSLLAQQLQRANEPAIVDDIQSTTPPLPENHFYENAARYLLIAMLMAALATEIGGGLALYEAWKMSSNPSEDWQALRDRLSAIHARLLGLAFEAKRLQLEGDVFVARFWRNFYDAMLKHTLRSAMTKLLIFAAAVVFCGQLRASDQQALNMVIAIDLTKSVATRGPDNKTDFEKNVEAVGKLLSQVPANSRVTVIGITKSSFTQPYILLSALLPADPGYFGERLTSARKHLVTAWKARSEKLAPEFAHTDIIGALLLASDLFSQQPAVARKVLVLFSDMRQSTRELNLESPAVVPEFSRTKAKVTVANMRDVQVFALGVDGFGKSTSYWESLRAFWDEYFRCSGADLQDYSPLREVVAVIRSITDHPSMKQRRSHFSIAHFSFDTPSCLT
jgi:hypothetical protein